ncbi:MAG: hypothetical protein AB1546_07975, partial [bacterium]
MFSLCALCLFFALSALNLVVASTASKTIYAAAPQQNSNFYTAFQDSAPWQKEYDIRTDVAFVYTTGDAERIRSWRERGYEVWTMFGASWLGKNEPIVLEHPEIVQMMRGYIPFEMIPGRAWIVPTRAWIDYSRDIVSRLISAGTNGILPEEPEFFVSTGFSKGFKKEWRDFYGEPWRNPSYSLDSHYKASRLKAHLFYRYYKEIFAYTKQLNPAVRCVIPAHSNINYADWGIISPHARFLTIPELDGFIAQVWTGTARHRHNLAGTPVSRPFEYAYLEYSYFDNLVRGTGKEVWFLTDPIEDDPNFGWRDYREWYQNTLAAALFFPEVTRYEVIPWTQRVFGGTKYQSELLPQSYATELLTVWAAQREMHTMRPERIRLEAGTSGIGVLTADTLMWQRGIGTTTMDAMYGLLLPLITSGVPVRVVPIERVTESDYLKNIRVLLLSYDALKPEEERYNDAIADWVRSGGVLVFYGGADDFNLINSWWKEKGFSAPQDDLLINLLLEKVGIPRINRKILRNDDVSTDKTINATDATPASFRSLRPLNPAPPFTSYDVKGAVTHFAWNEYPIVWEKQCGRGTLIYAGISPAFAAADPKGVQLLMELLRYAHETKSGGKFNTADSLVLHRDKYLIAHALKNELHLTGTFIDLFNPFDPLIAEKVVPEGENAFLLDLDYLRGTKIDTPVVLLAAGKIEEQ